MTRHVTTPLFAAVTVLALGCSGGEHSTPADKAPAKTELTGKLVCTGSSTCAPLVSDIADRFRATHPGVEIDVKMGGSSVGIRDAREGKADIGMSSRALQEKDGELHSVVIAKDGICLIVHKDNPVTKLSLPQVEGIYKGTVTNWKEVGGRDAPVAVFNRDKNRSESELFSYFFLIEYGSIKAPKLGDNPECLKAVSEDPNAIVYISVGEAELAAQKGMPIKLLPIDGVAATVQNIRSGDFRLSRKLILVTKDRPAGLAKAFVDFATSPDVKDLVEKHHFVPVD